MNFNITLADYSNQKHARDLVSLLDYYATDPAGGGTELSQYTQDNLVRELAKLNFAFSLICYRESMPVGLVNCFTLLSTFKCKPIINIHDLVVVREYRRQGISQLLLEEVEKIAREKGACKITLEVLEKNYAAKKSYEKFGFVGCQLDPQYGNAIFLEKTLF